LPRGGQAVGGKRGTRGAEGQGLKNIYEHQRETGKQNGPRAAEWEGSEKGVDF